MKIIDQLDKNQLRDKKILLRVDFNVPLTQSPITNHQSPTIGDGFKIKSHKETVDYLLNSGARVLLVSHIDGENSFTPIVEELGKILGFNLSLISHKDFFSVTCNLKPKTLYLLDNIRQDPRETEDDDELAQELANGFDYYVNDAFAVMHREHASVAAITKYLPSFAGLLVKKEIENLGSAMDAPVEGKILVLGGAKISTKLPVIKNFLNKAEKILIGGALANIFFRVQGIKVGASVVDDAVAPDVRGENIVLPRDFVTGKKNGNSGSVKLYKKVSDIGAEEAILDIGPETAKEWAEIIEQSKMVIWNGPMGLSEVAVFAEGTRAIAEAVTKAEKSIIGGGDTIAAANKLGLLDRYSFVSTGGGAMLEFLAGNKLPGLEALGYYI